MICLVQIPDLLLIKKLKLTLLSWNCVVWHTLIFSYLMHEYYFGNDFANRFNRFTVTDPVVNFPVKVNFGPNIA